MSKGRMFFILFILALCHWGHSLLAQNAFDQICVPPSETNRGLAATITYPYYPAKATLKALVIFVKFSDDTTFDLSPNTDLWPRNLVGLPSWAANIISPTVQPTYSNPSISGYFDEMSLNKFQLIGDVYTQLYTPLHEQSYYWISSGRNISYLTEEILTQLDPSINYAQYDNLSLGGSSPDGIVDMIFICFRFFNSDKLDGLHYQGFASLTGNYSTFGSGSSTLTFDGKQIKAGFPGSGTIQHSVLCLHSIGIIVHEYGHYLFGGIHYTGIGYWGLMDGAAPGPMCAFERAKTGIGWITPTLITSNKNDILQDAITTGDAKKIEVTPGSHYFLTENRRQLSYYESNWLRYNGGPLTLPGPGLLITHVLYNSNIDVECADKKWDWQKSGSNYVYPFVALNPNPFSGLDEMELRDVYTTAGIQSHPDFRGDSADTYKSDVYTMFSPWSNPYSNSLGGYGPDKFSDEAIILRSMNGNDMSIDFYATLASNIFSASTETIAFNSQRKVCRTSDSRMHVVFESEGEIFYRRTMTDGTTWETSTSVKLSTGNYNNQYPSITGTSSKQFVVWQRYTGYSGGEYKYDTYFAKNTGSGWTTAKINNLSTLGFGTQTNPLPVITYKSRSGGYRLLVCCRTGSGIRYVTSDNDGSTWSASASLPATTASHQNPSLSMGPTTPSGTVYIAYDNNSIVYTNAYTSGWGSAQDISSGSGTSSNRYPSIEVDGNGGRNVAWQGYSPALLCEVIVHRRNAEPFHVFENLEYCYRPSVTGHTSNRCSIVCYDIVNDVYRLYYSGSSWSSSLIAGNGKYPNLSAGTTTAKYVWTSGSSSPYEIKLSSETLPPGGLLKLASNDHSPEETPSGLEQNLLVHHSAMLQDSACSTLLWVELGEMSLTTQRGASIPISLEALPDSFYPMSLEKPFQYLESEPFVIGKEAVSLTWQENIYGVGLNRLISSAAGKAAVAYQLVEAITGVTLGTLKQEELANSAFEFRQNGTVSQDVTEYIKKEVKLRVVPRGLLSEAKGVVAGLAEVYINSGTALPKENTKPQDLSKNTLPLTIYCLEQNYPNPFNPTTSIRYQLPAETRVTIGIYNLQGQLVAKLVDEQQGVGFHTVGWHAGNLASGLYLCRMQSGSFVAVQKMMLLR